MAKRKYSANELVNDIATRLVQSGWERLHKNRHWRLRSPDGKTTVTVPGSCSDHRAGLNWRSQLRHIGVEIPA